LMYRRELGIGTRAFLSYTLSRSERERMGGGTRLFDGDETHVLTMVGSRQWGAWSLSARGRYATGAPRTPVVGSFFDARAQREEPLFGPQNSVRLPAFYALDARVDPAWATGAWQLTLSLDIENVTAHRNPEEIVYTQDFQSSGYLTGPPLLVLLGVRLEV